MRPSRLRCEYLADPLGIDERWPRLSWCLETGRRGARQSARRILVASSAQKLARGEGDLWDSGRIEDDRTDQISYGGRPLGSRRVCHWRVRVWDERGEAADSEPALWTMGLLEPEDWRCAWIGADPKVWEEPGAVAPGPERPGSPVFFRREFQAPARIRRATLYASARGLFELHLGGRRVGRDLFAPEWTDYRRRIHYRTYDVTALLSAGRNVLGAVLGDGWWSGFLGWQERRGRYGLENSLAVQLEIEFGEGGVITVGTGRDWHGRAGPILSSDFMMGEDYDARREQPGWLRPGFDPAGWLPARTVRAPEAALVSQRSEPVRITEVLRPVSVREAEPGRYICDLGQNISGWVRLRVRGRRGTRVVLRHAERLNPDGSLYTENLRRARATDSYVLRGGGRPETWEPRFTFHGFQYVEVSGLPRPPRRGDILGCAVHSALEAAGTFECSHPGVNRLWLNTRWSQRDNFLSVPTDCPQRDERLGWTGDAQVFLRTAACNFDVAAFFTKWMIDVEDAQSPEGMFPDTAPRLPEGPDHVGLDGLAGAAGWADAGVIIPWTLWRLYGDLRVVERHWMAMKAWCAYLERTNPDWVRRRDLGNNYGDWLCLPSDRVFREGSPMKTLLATAYWADDEAKMAQMARALGRRNEERRHAAAFERVRAAFQSEFLRPDGRLAVETQTAYLLALAFDLLPEPARAGAAARLVELVRERGWHLSTGFIGVRFLNPVLTEAGHPDVAYRLLLREDYPSWLYPIRHGATTIWERWNGWTRRDGFFNPEMNSFNHYALGSVGEWLFRHVAGIEPAEPGFRRLRLRPWPGRGLRFARASYRTPQGRVESGWERSGSRLTWTVRVPPNVTALACVPSEPGTAVTEGGKPLEEAPGVESVRRAGRFLECCIGPGPRLFRSVFRP